jgi:hypothetical protein
LQKFLYITKDKKMEGCCQVSLLSRPVYALLVETISPTGRVFKSSPLEDYSVISHETTRCLQQCVPLKKFKQWALCCHLTPQAIQRPYMTNSPPTRIQKEAIQVTKEIVVKFIEIGRISPNNFDQFFATIYNEVLRTISQHSGSDPKEP